MRYTGTVSFVEQNGSVHARGVYKKNGQRKEKWCKVTTTKKAAKETVIEKIERDLSGEQVKTFRQLAEYYKAHHAVEAEYVGDEKVRGIKTWKQARSVVGDLTRFYKDAELNSITRDRLSAYRVQLAKKPVKHIRDKKEVWEQRSLASVNQHMRILRTVLGIAEQEGWISKVPKFKGLISSASEAKREDMPTTVELTRILQACGTRQRLNHVRPIVIMLADTGARPVELWNLKWKDVDLDKRLVTLTNDKGKRRNRREVPISARLYDELMELPRTNHLVFGGLKSVKRAWQSIKKLAKVDVDLYSLRHFFATRIDMMPMSQNQREKLLGHTSGAMFGRYAKLTDETIVSVREMLDAENVVSDAVH
jgi:integrase